jgi:hypothetical protein
LQCEPVSTAELQRLCADKTAEWRSDKQGEVFPVGEKLNDYCVGFLEGTLLALRSEKLACPEDTDVTDSHFLLSVVEFYLKDTPANSADATAVVTAAFKRAFVCKD